VVSTAETLGSWVVMPFGAWIYALVLSVLLLSVVRDSPAEEYYQISRIDSASEVNSELEHAKWCIP
jgi:hypothetical protein